MQPASPLPNAPFSFAEHTTFGIGGPAGRHARVGTAEAVRRACRVARAAGEPVLVLGGGSNLLVADEGFPGLVLLPEPDEPRWVRDGAGWRVEAWAGLPWDDLVAASVARGLGGLACLSGIPGATGATPIQNVGAYGQEVGERIVEVHVYDLEDDAFRCLSARTCAFGYRDSLFKSGSPGRFVVLSVVFHLPEGPPAPPRYADLARTLAAAPSAEDVRQAVLALRRARSMVVDPTDPDSRSAGSFFTNPLVEPDVAAAAARVLVEDAPPMPSWPAAGGRVKLAAAWLIERAGFLRGFEAGPVGLSRHHALAIVNRGGARAADVVALARRIREEVRARFGVTLVPEPVCVGFRGDPWA